MATLAENDITLDIEIVKNDANKLFNANVGIHQLIDLPNDNQLQDAIQLIKTGGIEAILAPAPPETVDL